MAKPKNPFTKRAPEIIEAVIEAVSNGTPLAQIVLAQGIGLTTWYDWCKADAELAERFGRARDAGFDVIATDTLAIVDTKPERTPTEHGDKVDAGHVAWLKNRAEQRLKLLAKWDPRRYGEKVAIGGAEDLPPVQSTVTLDPSEAYKRMLGGGNG